MDAGRVAGPAIKDLGILDVQGWIGSGGTRAFGKLVLAQLRGDPERQAVFLATALELKNHSVVARDPADLAIVLSRIAAIVVFMQIAAEKVMQQEAPDSDAPSPTDT